MTYIAHKVGTRTQTLKDHLEGTAELAGEFASKFGYRDWGYCAGMLHDIGKYSKEFQNKITNDTSDRVDHSTAGAREACKYGSGFDSLAYCIAGHHSGLSNYGQATKPSTLANRLSTDEYSICDYVEYGKEISKPALKNLPNIMGSDNPSFAHSVFIRMIYSCLVDADYLDTEAFVKSGKTYRTSGESIPVLLERFNDYISKHGWLKCSDLSTINGRRTDILKHCQKGGKQKKGLFTLTVPTGGGKTTASLAFALQHAKENNMDRVIYVIPYTSIIEQNAKIFIEILGDNNVLENHCNVSYNDSEDKPSPMRLASENWDKPVVVTTNVQFFESLFSNKSSRCRKLHNIANSVVIFDEAQMIPRDYLTPCMEAVKELIRAYDASLVLCTATQPDFNKFLGNIGVYELCPDVDKQFDFFRRVTYENKGVIKKQELIDILKMTDKSTLCIVNTRKLAQDIYKNIKEDGVYHLSTSMYPAHRNDVLRQVKEVLTTNKELKKQGKPQKKCILIATSLVEAGVDVDFDCVYRQMAGLDSIIQAAGRCNREGTNEPTSSKAYIFDIEGEYTPQTLQAAISATRGVINKYKNDISCRASISEYFSQLHTNTDSHCIMGSFSTPCHYDYQTAAENFKLIESNTKTIVINDCDDATQLLEKIKISGPTRELMRKIGQYTIQIFDSSNGNSLLESLKGMGAIKPIIAESEDIYELVSTDKYTREYGLDYSSRESQAIYM